MSRTIRFEASLPWPLHEVSRGLRELAWTYPRPAGMHATPGRIVVDLHVPVGSSGAASHRAIVDLGTYEPAPAVCRVPVEISMGRGYPSFHGCFEAREAMGETDLALVGTYRLPLGIVGQLSGSAGGNGMARASLRRFFETAVTAIKADLHAAAPVWRPAPRPDSLRDT